MKKIISLLLLILCSVNLSFAQYANVIDPELQQIMNEKNNDLISVNIIFKSQIDAEKLNVQRQSFSDKASKKEFTLKEFKKFSQKSQADVLSILEAETRSNSVADIKCHWITNMINCKTTADVIYKLSQHPDVAAIAYNKMEYLLFGEKSQDVEPVRGMADNVKFVNADDVWNQGYTGKGVVVAVLDTGVNTKHADLKDHLWDGGQQYPNHGYNTLDNNYDVSDKDGHGTHCAGTICGDGTSGTQTGIAPDATLMCIKVLGEDGRGSVETVVSGVEFSVEHGADIVSISAGFPFPNIYVSNIMRQTFINTLNLDVVASVAAGNEGNYLDDYPTPRNVNSPGNCPPPWLHPDQQANAGGLTSVVCVGAVDYYDVPAYFTAHGPVTWLGSAWNDYVLDMSGDIEEGWLYYDNNYYIQNVGGVDNLSWGIMFPPSKLEQYAGGELTKVAIYDNVYFTGNIEIYQGGKTPSNGVLLHTQPFVCYGDNALIEFDLNKSLPIDHTQNLWVVLQTNEGFVYPVASCPMTDDPNGRWIKINGKWMDNCEIDINYTWMLRAFVENYGGEIASLSQENEFGLIRPDISAPGMGIVSLAHYSNSGYTKMSGTSMATPCVSGAMALMLEKNPELTPAQICEAFEMTAVKLTETKSNLTGSGRIDVLAAIESIEEGAAPTADIQFVSCDPLNIEADAETKLNVTLINNGKAVNDKNFILNLMTENQYVDIVDGIVDFGKIKAGESVTKAFTVKVSSAAPHNHIVEFLLKNAEYEPWNVAFSATISNTLNVSEYENRFEVYPNPVNNTLFISTNEIIKEINIFNVVGINVYSCNENNNFVNMSDLGKGVYFVKIKTDKAEIVKRVVKN